MDIYNAIAPLYFYTNLLGLSPYTFNREKNNRKYVESKYSFYYFYSVIIFLIAYHYFVVLKHSSLISEMEFRPILGFADIVHVYGVTLVVSVIFIFNYSQKGSIIKAINIMHSVDMELKQFGSGFNHKWIEIMNIFILIFGTAAVVLTEYLNCNLFISHVELDSIICYLVCLFPLIVIMLEEFTFLLLWILLKNRFKAINNLLENDCLTNKDILHNKPNYDKETIIKLRSLHLELCLVGQLLNGYFSIQILILIGFSFVGFTTNAYYFIGVISDNFVYDNGSFNILPSAIISTSIKFIEILFISVVCSITKHEVNLTGEILYKIQSRYKAEIVPQIHLFGKQIMHCNFKITASDFFDIDMTLFYGIMGSAATYLVILIQFDVAINQSKQISSAISHHKQ